MRQKKSQKRVYFFDCGTTIPEVMNPLTHLNKLFKSYRDYGWLFSTFAQKLTYD
jgi:hypothetical protein